jgi:hypothetical protein
MTQQLPLRELNFCILFRVPRLLGVKPVLRIAQKQVSNLQHHDDVAKAR